MPDRSKVMTQTKRDTLVLQVGGLAWGKQPHTVKNLLLRKWNKGKSWIDLKMVERVGDRKKMEGYCSTGQSPQRAVVPVEEEEEESTFSRDVPRVVHVKCVHLSKKLHWGRFFFSYVLFPIPVTKPAVLSAVSWLRQLPPFSCRDLRSIPDQFIRDLWLIE
jgi:hypothetical protein